MFRTRLRFSENGYVEAGKLERFAKILENSHFSIYPNSYYFKNLNYKNFSSEYNEYNIRGNNKTRNNRTRNNRDVERTENREFDTSIYCLTSNYTFKDDWKKSWSGGYIVLLDAIIYDLPSRDVFKCYKHQNDNYYGYETRRLIDKLICDMKSRNELYIRGLKVI